MSEVWIDAFNVMHRMEELRPLLDQGSVEGRREARLELQRLLIPLLSRDRKRWTLVVDGSRYGQEIAPGPLHIQYAPSADDWMIESLRKRKKPDEILLVSSDQKDIAGPARQLGARVMSAEELIARIRKNRRGKAVEEKPQRISSEEVDYWLEQFGAGDGPSGNEANGDKNHGSRDED
ncbi:MAG: NYN domain-containing protein [Candidatus Krumholzibacteria bacterium]|jgi:predicted RNA-binding protein with PIN domain|nr:NYN domain-containing protein [Candidatus Krumholzibacteria bacterium]MDP6668667.1 NYN domain-containing protein [Candidatus Krumholzibacteria bacterium]MDP6796266.1 NYN domain-containing protein [Candidatus Krumholzibacteria bacterium]MDP7021038.1 NYN domain-containing protein [Candidatus Krumholzibacteria bacterium]